MTTLKRTQLRYSGVAMVLAAFAACLAWSGSAWAVVVEDPTQQSAWGQTGSLSDPNQTTSDEEALKRARQQAAAQQQQQQAAPQQPIPQQPGATQPYSSQPGAMPPGMGQQGAGQQGMTQTQQGAGSPMTMPMPPTYSPGSPAGYTGEAGVTPDGMPMAPTAPWPVDPNAQQGGMGPGFGMTGPRQSPSGFGFAGPQSPSPTPALNPQNLDPMAGRYDLGNVRQSTTPRQAATVGQARAGIMQTPKPFANYQRPSGYSPYMGLFREDNGRGINNYYEYVRPRLEQQQQNTAANRQLQQLGDNARLDYQAIQQSNQRPGNTVRQEQRTPATFMNYGQYFGGGTQR